MCAVTKDILCPSSSIEANQFVDSYVAKKTKFVEHHDKMPAPGIHFFKLCFHIAIHFCLILAILGNVKLLMDALHIPYADIEVELKMYTATGLIHKVLPGILAPYQMVWFLVEFNIINATI